MADYFTETPVYVEPTSVITGSTAPCISRYVEKDDRQYEFPDGTLLEDHELNVNGKKVAGVKFLRVRNADALKDKATITTFLNYSSGTSVRRHLAKDLTVSISASKPTNRGQYFVFNEATKTFEALEYSPPPYAVGLQNRLLEAHELPFIG